MSTGGDSCTRRDLLGIGWAAMGLRAARIIAAPQPDSQFITKTIPSTGERLPAIGLGTDAFYRSEQPAIESEIQRMIQLGGTVIDTSSDYGDSETLIGAALATPDLRNRTFLA